MIFSGFFFFKVNQSLSIFINFSINYLQKIEYVIEIKLQ